MKYLPFLVVAFLFLGSPLTRAESKDAEFFSVLVVTGNVQEFFKQWKKPSSPDYVPRINQALESTRGETVHIMVFFANCKQIPASGVCETVMDLKVLNPDGSTYAEFESLEVWRDKSTPANAISLSRVYLAFRIEPDDQTGTYLIIGQVHDQGSGKRVETRTSLVVKGLEQI